MRISSFFCWNVLELHLKGVEHIWEFWLIDWYIRHDKPQVFGLHRSVVPNISENLGSRRVFVGAIWKLWKSQTIFCQCSFIEANVFSISTGAGYLPSTVSNLLSSLIHYTTCQYVRLFFFRGEKTCYELNEHISRSDDLIVVGSDSENIKTSTVVTRTLGQRLESRLNPSEWRVKPQTHATRKSSICIVIDESLRDTKRRWTTITMKLEIPFDIPFLNILHQCCLSTWNWVYFILFQSGINGNYLIFLIKINGILFTKQQNRSNNSIFPNIS